MNKTMVESEIENVATIKEAIFWFFGFIAVATFKILGYFMPKTYKAIIEAIKKDFNKETLAELKKLEKEMANYKAQKHAIENEHVAFRKAILKGNLQELKIIREILKNEKQ